MKTCGTCRHWASGINNPPCLDCFRRPGNHNWEPVPAPAPAPSTQHDADCQCVSCMQRRLIEELTAELRIVRHEVRELKAWASRKQAEENAADLRADSGRTA